MNQNKKNGALKAGLWYTVGNVLIKGINFLTLPIFSRLLTEEEFGIFNVFLSYDAILFVVVGLALHTSIRSANSEFSGKIDEYTASVSLIYLINAAILLLAVTIFGGVLSQWMGFRRSILYMLVLYSVGSAVLMLYNTRISLDYSYKQYLAAAMVNSVGNVLVSLLLILTVFRSQKDLGRILGSTAVIAVLALVLLVGMYRKARPKYHREYWKFGLKYSLPIVPHGVSQVLLAQFDRVMIHRMVSASAAGIYSLAANIKLILTVITTSVSTAWSTWFYGEMDRKNHPAIQKRASQIAALFTVLAVGLMALAPELTWILGGKKYDLAKFVAIPMILDAFVLFLYDLLVVGEYYAKKTIYIMLGTMLAAALNLVLNYVFILKYGFLAAAYTTLVSYVCYLLIHLFISRKLVGFFILPLKWMLIYSVIAAVMAVCSLVFVDALLLRWGICAVIVIPMAALLLKNYLADRGGKAHG